MADSPVLDLPDGVYEDVPGWSGMIRHPGLVPLTAGAYPVKPPSSWFANPKLTSLTPLTISDDGHVFGHIAAWHTSHIGMAGGVKPPRSKSGYAYYQTGVVKCDDGKLVNVGQITLTGGHAPLNAGVARAVAHYDDTASAIMDVTAGEDKHGIWVAGALRPEVSDAQLRSIRASSVSGDWRPINGRLELVAVCAVNAPGFPIPRARVASGAPIALVAAGIEPLVEIAMNDRIENRVEQGIQAGLELFRERILRLENVVLADGGLVQGDHPDMTTEEAVGTDWDRQIKLRKRVRGSSALAASLRERVRGPVPKEVVADVESLAASLRARVKGSDVDPKELAPKALTAARGSFNPLLHPRGADGRFIEVGSWVRWLRQGFGSTRRGEVKEIIPDPNHPGHDGVPGKVVAKVEFPDRDGKTIIHDVPFDELEKVAAPKGKIDKSGDNNEISKKIAAKAVGHLIHDDEHHADGPHTPGTEDGNDTMNRPDSISQADPDEVKDAVDKAVKEVVAESVPDTPADVPNPTDEQLQAEEIANLEGVPTDATPESDVAGEGLIETPYVPPSDEWEKTSHWFEDLQGEDNPVAENLVDELRPDVFDDTSSWADAVSLARQRYENWRTEQLASDPEADVSLEAYLAWLESKGLKASLIAGLRADARVRGDKAILAHATKHWTSEKRDAAAKKGIALPDGSYPISDVEDLRKAVHAYGRADDKGKAKKHIIKRARALGEVSILPEGWTASGDFNPAKGPLHAHKSTSEIEQLRGRVHGAR